MARTRVFHVERDPEEPEDKEPEDKDPMDKDLQPLVREDTLEVTDYKFWYYINFPQFEEVDEDEYEIIAAQNEIYRFRIQRENDIREAEKKERERLGREEMLKQEIFEREEGLKQEVAKREERIERERLEVVRLRRELIHSSSDHPAWYDRFAPDIQWQYEDDEDEEEEEGDEEEGEEDEEEEGEGEEGEENEEEEAEEDDDAPIASYRGVKRKANELEVESPDRAKNLLFKKSKEAEATIDSEMREGGIYYENQRELTGEEPPLQLLAEQLVEMGFTWTQAWAALEGGRNTIDAALQWLSYRMDEDL